LISTQNLSYAYPGGAQMHFPDLQLKQDSSLLVLGNSGKGKTTFLHLLGGLLVPDSGSVNIHETDLTRLSSKSRDRFRGRHIGIVFQRSYFLKALTVEENLKLAMQLAGLKPSPEKIRKVLAFLNIEHKSSQKPQNLSIGEQQRASIARAVVHRPALLLADEPTSALDDENALRVAELLQSTAQENNSTLVIVTHDNRLKSIFQNRIEL